MVYSTLMDMMHGCLNQTYVCIKMFYTTVKLLTGVHIWVCFFCPLYFRNVAKVLVVLILFCLFSEII